MHYIQDFHWGCAGKVQRARSNVETEVITPMRRGRLQLSTSAPEAAALRCHGTTRRTAATPRDPTKEIAARRDLSSRSATARKRSRTAQKTVAEHSRQGAGSGQTSHSGKTGRTRKPAWGPPVGGSSSSSCAMTWRGGGAGPTCASCRKYQARALDTDPTPPAATPFQGTVAVVPDRY